MGGIYILIRGIRVVIGGVRVVIRSGQYILSEKNRYLLYISDKSGIQYRFILIRLS